MGAQRGEQVMATKSDTASGSAAMTLIQLATAFKGSRAIYVATELGIPDLLASGPKSSTELATDTRTNPSSLRRLMRALCAIGIFREAEQDRFDLLPMGSLFRSGVPDSQRAR